MDTFGIVVEQIGLFVVYILAGVALVKTKVFCAETLEVLAKYVLKLGLPVLIFINTVNGVQRETLFSSTEVIALTAVLYAFFFLESLFLAKVFRLKGNTALVYRAISMFGNIGFMGIPIISSIYPQSGMLYISLVTIVDQSVLWTLGVKLTTPEGAEGGFKLKKMINPATTAIALALVFIIARIPVPGVINTGLQKIGGTATPLAMIYLGGVFACMDIRRYAFRPELYGIVLVKMLVAPILVYLVLGFVPIFADLHMTIALLTALPAMASAVMMAKASGSEGDYAMGGIFVTTIGSIVTLPIVCWLLQHFFTV